MDGLPQGPTASDGPHKLSRLPGREWWQALRRTVKQFQDDNLSDWAAALTYYGVQSIFPGLLVLVSVVGLLGRSTTQRVLDNITGLTPGPVRDILHDNVQRLQAQHTTAGILAIVGVLAALWSASGYIGAFMRAANAIYDVPEGRPVWKTIPIRLGMTVAVGVALSVTALAVVLTGGVAKVAGRLLHLGDGVVAAWDIAKWPVLVILVSLVFALLYWAAPNARQGGFRWISPGGLLATLIWLAASTGFALYVTHFKSYDKTYGSVAAVIVFLVWLWISNLALLLGAEFDAELQRGRAITAGMQPSAEPYLDLRDTRKVEEASGNDLKWTGRRADR